MDKVRTIVCAGMIRSGSTWLYNAARLCLVRAGEQVYGCWIDDFDAQAAESASVTLIKIHEIDEDLADRAKVILTCHRDLRDIALSVTDMGWVADAGQSVDLLSHACACHEFWAERAALDLDYEGIVRQPLESIRQVATALRLNLSNDDLEVVLRDIEAITSKSSEKGYDPVNLTHRRHRFDGVPGRWKQQLDTALQSQIGLRHAAWLRRYGYMDGPIGISILGSPGHIRMGASTPTSELIRCVGGNTGNLIFQYAANRLVENPKKFIGATGIPYNSPAEFSHSSYLLFPAANHLRPGDHFAPLAQWISRLPVPLIVLGLGAQAPALAPDADSVRTIAAAENVRKLADAIKSKAAFVSVRGTFSQKVCAALGIEKTSVLGCPSFLLNPSRTLGRQIAERLEQAERKARKGSLRIAVTAAAPFEIDGHKAKMAVERVLFRWVCKYDSLYIQQSGGEEVVDLARQNFDHVEQNVIRAIGRILAPNLAYDKFLRHYRERHCIFWDAAEWLQRLESFDLAIGTRMHGNMAALAVGVPGIYIAHDSRTAELIDTMKLPHIAMKDLDGDIARSLRRVRFDPDAFDANRAHVAARFVEEMEKLGLQISENCKALANGVSEPSAPRQLPPPKGLLSRLFGF